MHTRSYLLISLMLCTYLGANQADHQRAQAIHEPTDADIATIIQSISATGSPDSFTQAAIADAWRTIKKQAIKLTKPTKMISNWSFDQAFTYNSKESILHMALSNQAKPDTDLAYAATALYLAKQYGVPIDSDVVILPFLEQTHKDGKKETRIITNENAPYKGRLALAYRQLKHDVGLRGKISSIEDHSLTPASAADLLNAFIQASSTFNPEYFMDNTLVKKVYYRSKPGTSYANTQKEALQHILELARRAPAITMVEPQAVAASSQPHASQPSAKDVQQEITKLHTLIIAKTTTEQDALDAIAAAHENGLLTQAVVDTPVGTYRTTLLKEAANKDFKNVAQYLIEKLGADPLPSLQWKYVTGQAIEYIQAQARAPKATDGEQQAIAQTADQQAADSARRATEERKRQEEAQAERERQEEAARMQAERERLAAEAEAQAQAKRQQEEAERERQQKEEAERAAFKGLSPADEEDLQLLARHREFRSDIANGKLDHDGIKQHILDANFIGKNRIVNTTTLLRLIELPQDFDDLVKEFITRYVPKFNPNAPYTNGKEKYTALMLAEKSGNTKIVAYLTSLVQPEMVEDATTKERERQEAERLAAETAAAQQQETLQQALLAAKAAQRAEQQRLTEQAAEAEAQRLERQEELRRALEPLSQEPSAPRVEEAEAPAPEKALDYLSYQEVTSMWKALRTDKLLTANQATRLIVTASMPEADRRTSKERSAAWRKATQMLRALPQESLDKIAGLSDADKTALNSIRITKK